jgi:hypothetical protein
MAKPISSSEIKEKLSALLHLTQPNAGDEAKIWAVVLLHEIFESLGAIHDDLSIDKHIASTFFQGGATVTLVQVLKRNGQCGEFYHKICAIIGSLVRTSQDIAMDFVKNGLVDATMRLMKSWSSDTFVLLSCVSVLLCIVYGVTNVKRIEIANETGMMESMATVLEEHGRTNVVLYGCSCHVLGHCFSRGLKSEPDLFKRIVQCVWAGITAHPHDEEEQAIGRCLLYRLVGPEAAKKMIDHAEMHHCEGARCSCAA